MKSEIWLTGITCTYALLIFETLAIVTEYDGKWGKSTIDPHNLNWF